MGEAPEGSSKAPVWGRGMGRVGEQGRHWGRGAALGQYYERDIFPQPERKVGGDQDLSEYATTSAPYHIEDEGYV